MSPFRTPRPLVTIVLLSAVLSLLGSPAQAQRRPTVSPGISGGFRFHAAAGQTRSHGMDGATCNPTRDSLIGPSGYPGGVVFVRGSYTPGPYGDYSLTGTADVIEAQGHYLVNTQRSGLVREQVQQSKLVTQRRTFDEYLYERQTAPTWEDDRDRLLGEKLRRSRTDPPLNEIISGEALNALLAHLQKRYAGGVSGPDVPLDEDALSRVNVVSGRDGSVGLLKDGGRLHWPLALTGDAVRGERQQIDSLLGEVLAQAASGTVNADAINDLTQAGDRLRQYLGQRSKDLPPGQYVAARRFLTDLGAALKTLQQPDAADYLSHRLAARGKTVAELVRSMTQQGLRFAPATSGDEAAYLALQRALAAYDSSGQAHSR